MAVFDLIPGISAHIHAGGSPVTEYDDVDDIQVEHVNREISKYLELRTVSKYIESITDTSFSVVVSVQPPYKIDCSKLGFQITVDGKEAWTSTCCRPEFGRNGSWEDTIVGIKEGKGRSCTIKTFNFAKIETHSNTPELTRIQRIAQHLSKVGTIEIKVYRERYGKKGGPTFGTSRGFISEAGIKVPEKSLKGQAKSHGTSLGDPTKTRRGNVWNAPKIDGEEHPLVIFRFKYRSNEALRQLMIIPRSQSPPRSLSNSPEPKAIPSEILQRLFEETVRKYQADCAENRLAKPTSSRGIKREHIENWNWIVSRGPIKRTRKSSERVMIDLTAESEENEGGLFL